MLLMLCEGHFPFPEDPFPSFLSDEFLATVQFSASTSSGETSLTLPIQVHFYIYTSLMH